MGVRRRSGADKFDISSGDLRELCVNLLIFSRLFACFAGPFPGAKAGAFAYNAFRGPPKSTLQLQNSAVATIAAGVKMTL
jgi:hypothetical protein